MQIVFIDYNLIGFFGILHNISGVQNLIQIIHQLNTIPVAIVVHVDIYSTISSDYNVVKSFVQGEVNTSIGSAHPL